MGGTTKKKGKGGFMKLSQYAIAFYIGILFSVLIILAHVIEFAGVHWMGPIVPIILSAFGIVSSLVAYFLLFSSVSSQREIAIKTKGKTTTPISQQFAARLFVHNTFVFVFNLVWFGYFLSFTLNRCPDADNCDLKDSNGNNNIAFFELNDISFVLRQ